MEQAKIQELRRIATDIRIGIIEAVYNAGSGHPGGSLDCGHIDAPLLCRDEYRSVQSQQRR